ncbi:MAG: S8 family peptidase [Bacteroidia bacterium]|nr:S8 family peptidase [Bacteroidia bacterium]
MIRNFTKHVSVVSLLAVIINSNILSAQNNLSPSSRWLLSSEISNHDKNVFTSAGNFLHCFIQVTPELDIAALEACQATINTKAGNIYTVTIPLANLAQLSNVKGIEYIEASTMFNGPGAKNDLEQKQTHVDKVHAGVANGLPQDYFGKDVIVGIVDIGFQTDNPTMYDATGTKNRIVRYWHQSYNLGTPPAGFNYGSERTTEADILAQPDNDGIHGTHVTGIAAGSGFTSPNLMYRGIASEADIVLVTIKYANDTIPGSAIGDYRVANPNIIDAYKYIFDYANSVGKPAVINLSWGMHSGPHDGTSLFDLATKSIVGPGNILVGANGNEGANNMHIQFNLNSDTSRTFMIENGRQYRTKESVYCDFWGEAGKSFKMQVSFLDTNNKVVASSPWISSSADAVKKYSLFDPLTLQAFTVTYLVEDNYINNTKSNITVMANNSDQARYHIVLTVTGQGRVDGWNSGASMTWSNGSFTDNLYKTDFRGKYVNGNTESTMGENGGTSDAVISVGAVAARNKYTNFTGKENDDSWYVKVGDITPFSSKGPTMDGRIKPDISAPGYDVPSSINRNQIAPWMLNNVVAKTVFKNDTNYWMVASGTSMAAPHVTGIVALLLEANPTLSPTQIRAILQQTAERDSFTGNVPNNRFGWGRANAFEAIKQALLTSSVNTLNKGNQSFLLFPNPSNNGVTVSLNGFQSGSATLIITDISGRVIFDKTILLSNAEHKEYLDLSTIDAGLYMINVTQGNVSMASKLLKM